MYSLDKLLSDLSSLYEVERADNLAKYLKSKYKDIFEIDAQDNDPIINEYKDCLSELGNLSNIISITFMKELNIE